MKFTNNTLIPARVFAHRKCGETRATKGAYKLNDKPAFGYVLYIGDESAYRGSGTIKSYNAVFHRRFETDLEFTLHDKGLGHLTRLKNGTHINAALQKLWDETKTFRIELIDTYATRTEALAIELKDIKTGAYSCNVIGAKGQTRKRLSGGTVLTQVQVDEIKVLLAAGAKQVALAKQFGVSQTCISFIANGKHAKTV